MKVIPKLQQGNTIESDNTKVVRPEIHEPIKAKPRQYSIVDLGGEPSNDTRSAAERNRDYWHPIKGARDRFKASMSNETNPLVGIERTILPSAAGAALVTTPAAVVGGALGNMTVDKLTGGWGNWLEDKTGIPSEIGVYTNPGAWYGGAKGYKIGKNKLITKSIKGDADLAWNPINKNHWIFNKEARTPSNIAMATANRITPFLSKVEKLPLKVAAYKAALMDKVGRPFILQQSNPIWIEGSSVRNPELVTMAHGGRFDFKKSPLLKKQEEINGKRDMRKKFIKSSRPTYKKRIKKAQQGMKFVSYNPVSNPTIDYTDITNPINPFSEYNYNTTYDKPTALVVPTREDSKPDTIEEPDVVANNPTVVSVINKPVASKSVTDKPVTKTANSTWKSPYTNRKQWSTELINAYKKAGITNDNAIRMLLAQDALESSWGKSAQGKYNFGNLTTGSSWKGDYVTGNDKNAKGEAIKQKFRSYNSMDEYAADKVQFLKRLYDFDENDDINKFVAKLTGSNKGKRRYAEAKEYANSLRGVYNSFKAGGIIKYQEPAQPINRSAIRTDEDKNVPKRNRAIYSTFDATWNTPPWYIATAKAARAAYKQVANPDEMDYIVTDSVADAGWRKRLGLSYDSKFLPSNEDGSVRLPSYIEAEIPVDTTLLKDRIARETKIAESKNIMGKDWQLVTGLINLDKQNLDSLRKTYNTGEPTVLNEYSHNSRNLIKNGRLINGAHEYNTPLNILKNYTVQYDSKNRTMNYRDIYDFNGYEWAIPGKKFNIRGSINLDKK